MDNSGAFNFYDTHVIAAGGRFATGIGISDEEGGALLFEGGTVSVSEADTAIGLGGGEQTENLHVSDARIVVEGLTAAIGIGWSANDAFAVSLDRVVVDSSEIAVSLFADAGESTVATITGADLHGMTALQLVRMSATTVTDSTLHGEQWIRSAEGSSALDVADSLVVGSIDAPNAVLTCTNTLGSAYEPVGSDCMPIAP